MKGAMAAFALLGPLALGSCVADSVSLRITCSVVPEADCTYQTAGLCSLGGTLNLAVRRQYRSVLRVSSGLKPRDRDVPPQSEPNGVQVNQLEIEITDSAGRRPSFPPSLPNPYTVPANGSVPPAEEALIGAELLPQPYVNQLRANEATQNALGSVRLSVIARGTTSGDVDVESGKWYWTISFVTSSPDPLDGQCVTVEDEVCQLGQDGEANTCNPSLVEASP